MVCLLAEAPLGDDYSLWILVQTSMSQLTLQQSHLLCWELLPDRNRKSMGLWYWELMSHPDPAVLPVGTLHSWMILSKQKNLRLFSIQLCFSLRRPSVRSLKYPLLTCTLVRWSTWSTVTILRYVRPSGEVSGHLPENAWREWPKIYMLMYLDRRQNWLVYGYGLLIFLF